MRHASVDEKYAECYNGHIDISLSKAGWQEAAEAARRLDSIIFDAVYCSDLLRCKQSIEPFGLSDIVYDERLREKSWGRAEGMRFDDICKDFGLTYEGFETFVRAIGGESLEEFGARVLDFFGELRRNKTENTLIVTHGGVIKTVLAHTKKISLEKAFSLSVPYASITIIEDFV